MGLVNRLRATSAAAPAPNNSIIGGAGTGAGLPLDEPVDPEELDDEEDELELDEEPSPPVLLVLVLPVDPLELNPSEDEP